MLIPLTSELVFVGKTSFITRVFFRNRYDYMLQGISKAKSKICKTGRLFGSIRARGKRKFVCLMKVDLRLGVLCCACLEFDLEVACLQESRPANLSPNFLKHQSEVLTI